MTHFHPLFGKSMTHVSKPPAGPSDVIGLAVFLQPPDAGTSSSEMPASEMPANHIRFFKNGRDQGIAFTDIPPGIYFPSLSLYMGAKAAANFGPEWICPPETDIPLRPISSLRPLPEAEHLELTQNVERRRAEFMALQEQRESERLPPSSCDPASVLS